MSKSRGFRDQGFFGGIGSRVQGSLGGIGFGDQSFLVYRVWDSGFFGV